MEQKNLPASYRPPLFGNLRVMCAAALLAAIAFVLNYLSIRPTPALQIGLGNLPILISGIFLGPVIGGIVGAVSDLLGCLQRGDAPNLVITLGAALVGIASGLFARIATRKEKPISPLVMCISVSLGHILGSIVTKSIGMALFFHWPMSMILWRAPLYILTGAVEAVILVLLSRNKFFTSQLARLLTRKKGRKAK